MFTRSDISGTQNASIQVLELSFTGWAQVSPRAVRLLVTPHHVAISVL